MPNFNDLTEGLPEKHFKALKWFHENRGRQVLWSAMELYTKKENIRLSTKVKGIYRPKDNKYSLSVRMVQDGPYADKEVQYRPDGSWVCKYLQEYNEIEKFNKSAGNRGLIKCKEDQVPIGFLRKPRGKLAIYDVLGLGLITNWEGGYFTIEGLSDDGIYRSYGKDDAATMRNKLSDPDIENSILPEKDGREYVISTIARRQGQAAFRNSLIEAYDAKCCITGCDIIPALEAAHIRPYMGEHSNIVSNGLLLRGDIHTLFDLGLVAISDQYDVILAPNLADSTTYGAHSGNRIKLPAYNDRHPNRDFLRNHRKWAGFE